MRILDSKNPAMRELIEGAPQIVAHLDEGSRTHFEGLKRHLDACGIAYTVNPRLVRGLDYYTRTVFEWTTDALGSQDAVCSGGRYDGLVAQLGGEQTAAIGWALGIERVVELMRESGVTPPGVAPQVYVVLVGDRAERLGLALVEKWREALAGLRIATHLGGGSFKSQLKRADRSGASLAVIIGDDEAGRETAAIKPLRSDRPQEECRWPEVPARVRTLLS